MLKTAVIILVVLLIPVLFIFAQDNASQISTEFASNAGAALPESFSQPHSEVEPAAYSTADTLTVLAAPDERAQAVSALSLHQGMMLLGRAANSAWIKVSLPGDLEGWVDAHFIRSNVPVDTLPFVW
ncbi:MAG: SH3 domain-containing protein [Burkholderiales bacterium]|nr:SH3 domain-containing protein [Anaerolineae bacterium]